MTTATKFTDWLESKDPCREATDRLIETMVDDLARWYDRNDSEYAAARVAEFKIEQRPGRNYIKLVEVEDGRDRSVKGFIVKTPTKGFKVGDMLKAAGWSAPATNFKRGNVFNADARANWTGIG